MRIPLAIVLVLSFSNRAASQTIEEKICILSSARKLPEIQGLIITASITKQSTKDEIAKQLVGSFGNIEKAYETLSSIYWFGTGDMEDMVRYKYSRGGPEKVRATVISALSENLKTGMNVEITIKAATIDATYAFACGVGVGASYSASLGLLH